MYEITTAIEKLQAEMHVLTNSKEFNYKRMQEIHQQIQDLMAKRSEAEARQKEKAFVPSVADGLSADKSTISIAIRDLEETAASSKKAYEEKKKTLDDDNNTVTAKIKSLAPQMTSSPDEFTKLLDTGARITAELAALELSHHEDLSDILKRKRTLDGIISNMRDEEKRFARLAEIEVQTEAAVKEKKFGVCLALQQEEEALQASATQARKEIHSRVMEVSSEFQIKFKHAVQRPATAVSQKPAALPHLGGVDATAAHLERQKERATKNMGTTAKKASLEVEEAPGHSRGALREGAAASNEWKGGMAKQGGFNLSISAAFRGESTETRLRRLASGRCDFVTMSPSGKPSIVQDLIVRTATPGFKPRCASRGFGTSYTDKVEGSSKKPVVGVGFGNGVYAVFNGKDGMYAMYETWQNGCFEAVNGYHSAYRKFRTALDAICAIIAHYYQDSCASHMEAFEPLWDTLGVDVSLVPNDFSAFEGLLLGGNGNLPYDTITGLVPSARGGKLKRLLKRGWASEGAKEKQRSRLDSPEDKRSVQLSQEAEKAALAMKSAEDAERKCQSMFSRLESEESGVLSERELLQKQLAELNKKAEEIGSQISKVRDEHTAALEQVVEATTREAEARVAVHQYALSRAQRRAPSQEVSYAAVNGEEQAGGSPSAAFLGSVDGKQQEVEPLKGKVGAIAEGHTTEGASEVAADGAGSAGVATEEGIILEDSVTTPTDALDAATAAIAAAATAATAGDAEATAKNDEECKAEGHPKSGPLGLVERQCTPPDELIGGQSPFNQHAHSSNSPVDEVNEASLSVSLESTSTSIILVEDTPIPETNGVTSGTGAGDAPGGLPERGQVVENGEQDESTASGLERKRSVRRAQVQAQTEVKGKAKATVVAGRK